MKNATHILCLLLSHFPESPGKPAHHPPPPQVQQPGGRRSRLIMKDKTLSGSQCRARPTQLAAFVVPEVWQARTGWQEGWGGEYRLLKLWNKESNLDSFQSVIATFQVAI